MAGYIFSLDSVAALRNYVTNGVYATKLSQPRSGYCPSWRKRGIGMVHQNYNYITT